jgi:hypothetical protein
MASKAPTGAESGGAPELPGKTARIGWGIASFAGLLT